MPYTQQFDVLAPDDLTGEITQVGVYDIDKDPNRVLELGRDWWVYVEWTLKDDPNNYLVASLRGTWEVKVKLESMGEGFEGQVGQTAVIQLDGRTTPYDQWIYVSNQPDPANPDNQGAFKLVVLITFKDPAGEPQPMAGFCEGPMLQFYKPLP